MINNERVKYMAKLAEYESTEGRTDKKTIQYFRRDYVAMELIKSFVTGTIAFGLMFLMWAVYGMDNLLEQFNSMNITGAVTEVVIVYLVFMAIYLLATYLICNMRYTTGRKNVKAFYEKLQKVSRLYEEEENMPGADDWED